MRPVVHLILFMGQSNMAGRGDASLAPSLPDGIAWEYRAISQPDRLSPLAEPFGAAENNPDGVFEPGMKTGSLVSSFVRAYVAQTNVPVVAVSCAKGGSSILEWMPGTPFYRDALDRLKRARHFLEENGYDVEHTFLAWCQGCTDGDHKMDGNLYKEKTRTFLHAFMKEGRVETCFLIQIGNHRDHPDLYVPIQLAQKALCEEEESILLVSEQFRSFAAKGLMKDEFHYRQEAYNLVGEKAGTAAGKFAASISSRHAERSTFS